MQNTNSFLTLTQKFYYAQVRRKLFLTKKMVNKQEAQVFTLKIFTILKVVNIILSPLCQAVKV